MPRPWRCRTPAAGSRWWRGPAGAQETPGARTACAADPPGSRVRPAPDGCRAPPARPACRPPPGSRRRTAPRSAARQRPACWLAGPSPPVLRSGARPAALGSAIFPAPFKEGDRMMNRNGAPWRAAAVMGALMLALVLATPAVARQQAAPEPVHSAEGITEYALDNGMRVVLFPHSSRPVTTVNV